LNQSDFMNETFLCFIVLITVAFTDFVKYEESKDFASWFINITICLMIEIKFFQNIKEFA